MNLQYYFTLKQTQIHLTIDSLTFYQMWMAHSFRVISCDSFDGVHSLFFSSSFNRPLRTPIAWNIRRRWKIHWLSLDKMFLLQRERHRHFLGKRWFRVQSKTKKKNTKNQTVQPYLSELTFRCDWNFVFFPLLSIQLITCVWLPIVYHY